MIKKSNLTESQKGNIYIIVAGLITSLFPIITIIGLKGVPSTIGLFWATFFSTLCFLALVIFKKRWKELRNFKAWLYSSASAIFIGVIFYGLYFYGLTKTVSTNAAIVGLFEVATAYLFFQIIHKELMSKKHILGIILAVFGALIIFIPKLGNFYIGDLIILIATVFGPIGNWYQQKARNIASSETILFMRQIITLPFLFVLALLLGESPLREPLGSAFWWLLFNGIFVFGLSKVFWVEGIHRMTVTKALAIHSGYPFLTMIFAWILIGDPITLSQFLALPFLIAGVFILTDINFKGIFLLNKKLY